MHIMPVTSLPTSITNRMRGRLWHEVTKCRVQKASQHQHKAENDGWFRE